MDIVYLGNSLPKVNGGFNFTFRYGNWSLKTRFMYRFGNKVVNLARQNLEMMYNTYNMGLGMVIATAPEDVDKTMEALKAAGDIPYIVGEIQNGEKGVTLC